MSKHKFPYRWNIEDGYPADGIDYHGKTVFGTFVCGGGSTMGYKLAGFEHLGGVEIDPNISESYKENHNPKHFYTQDIRDFVKRSDLPEELYDLDLLDGSPPCSSFSMSGNREKDWGKEKKFKEGQALQRLDDLFFDYINLAEKLQSKVVLAENVRGLITGNAKAYVKRIKKKFNSAGYKVQLFLLNSASMGVPQRRERVFFICQRNDLKLPKLKLKFNEDPVLFRSIKETDIKEELRPSELSQKYWNLCKEGKSLSTVHPTGSWFNHMRLSDNKPCPTLMGDGKFKLLHSTECRRLSVKEWSLCGTYPLDYNYSGIGIEYLIGMSVPPVMTAQIAHQVYLQWLSNL